MAERIGYARVSSADQKLDTQIEKLKKSNCTKIFKEKKSGDKETVREELAKALEYMREGDTFIVTRLDRLARSVFDLHRISLELERRGIHLIVIDQNIDTSTSIGRFLFTMVAAVCEFEREIIKERAAEGLARAKRNGKRLGRPPKPAHVIKKALSLYDNREDNGLSVSDIIKMTSIPRATLYHELRKLKPPEETTG